MTKNKITLEEMMKMPIGDISKLSPKQLCELLHDANNALVNAKKIKQWIEAAVAMKYEEMIRAKRQRLEKDTGTIHIEDNGFKLTTDVAKKPVWDQEKLAGIVAKIKNEGDDPAEYVETSYKVSENKFKAWPKLIKKVFEPARTLKTGNPTYSLAPIDKEVA